MRFFGPILAARCATIGMAAWLSGCGSTESTCDVNDAGDDEGSEGMDAGAPGMIMVRGTVTDTVCPTVNPISVGPENGGTVELTATINGGAPDGGTVVLSWSAASGSFSDPSTSDTTFTCTSLGAVKVTLMATIPGCSQQATATVHCTTVN